MPTASPEILGIASGRTNDLWFAEGKARKLGRITTSGKITEFVVPVGYGRPYGVAVARSGAVWTASSRYFARMTMRRQRMKSGKLVSRPQWKGFAKPAPALDIMSLEAAPDGSLWYGGQDLSGGRLSRYGRISASGRITEFEFAAAGTNVYPRLHQGGKVAISPQGAVWFSPQDDTIARLTPQGTIDALYRVPIDAGGTYPVTLEHLVANSDGTVSFVIRYTQNREPVIDAPNVERVGTLSPDGSFALSPETDPVARVLAGPGGKPWLLQNRAPLQVAALGPLTPQGTPGPSESFRPNGVVIDMTLGPDGRFWFVHTDRNNRISRLTLGS